MFPPVSNKNNNKKYYNGQFVVHSREVFQRRLSVVEAELAQAQENMLSLRIQDEAVARDRVTALAMARHGRLGQDSPLQTLPDDLLLELILLMQPAV
jgi:hypothetical protein